MLGDRQITANFVKYRLIISIMSGQETRSLGLNTLGTTLSPASSQSVQEQGLHLCMENKVADQLRGNCAADLCLCFCICKKQFSHDAAHLIHQILIEKDTFWTV